MTGLVTPGPRSALGYAVGSEAPSAVCSPRGFPGAGGAPRGSARPSRCAPSWPGLPRSPADTATAPAPAASAPLERRGRRSASRAPRSLRAHGPRGHPLSPGCIRNGRCTQRSNPEPGQDLIQGAAPAILSPGSARVQPGECERSREQESTRGSVGMPGHALRGPRTLPRSAIAAWNTRPSWLWGYRWFFSARGNVSMDQRLVNDAMRLPRMGDLGGSPHTSAASGSFRPAGRAAGRSLSARGTEAAKGNRWPGSS